MPRPLYPYTERELNTLSGVAAALLLLVVFVFVVALAMIGWRLA